MLANIILFLNERPIIRALIITIPIFPSTFRTSHLLNLLQLVEVIQTHQEIHTTRNTDLLSVNLLYAMINKLHFAIIVCVSFINFVSYILETKALLIINALVALQGTIDEKCRKRANYRLDSL